MKKLTLVCSSKRSRTQVNLVEDNSQDEEQDGNAARQRRYKCAKTDQEQASATAKVAIPGLCCTHQVLGAKAWNCLGNRCPLENAKGFLMSKDQDREIAKDKDREKVEDKVATRSGLFICRTRTHSSGSVVPTAAAAPITHVQLQHPSHNLLFIRCRSSGCQFLVDGRSAVILWQLTGVPLKSTETTEVWKQFQSNWIATFGVHTLLLFNQGSQFTSAYWSEQCQMSGIRSETTPAYYPKANDMVEPCIFFFQES